MLHLLLKKLAPPPPPIAPVMIVEPVDFLTLAAAVLIGGVATCLVMLPIFWHMLKEWILYDDEVKTKIFFSTYRKVSACIVANGGIAPATPKRPPPAARRDHGRRSRGRLRVERPTAGRGAGDGGAVRCRGRARPSGRAGDAAQGALLRLAQALEQALKRARRVGDSSDERVQGGVRGDECVLECSSCVARAVCGVCVCVLPTAPEAGIVCLSRARRGRWLCLRAASAGTFKNDLCSTLRAGYASTQYLWTNSAALRPQPLN